MMNDVFVLDAVRTPFGKYGGALAGSRPDDLAAHVLRALAGRTGLDPSTVDEVVLGAGPGWTRPCRPAGPSRSATRVSWWPVASSR